MQAEKILSVLSYGGKGKRMKQTSVLTQTISIEQRIPIRYRWIRPFLQWMGLFLIEDVSPRNRQVVELQRRAIWIGVAMLLLTAIEFGYGFLHFLYGLQSNGQEVWGTSSITLLLIIGSLILFALVLTSFLTLWMAFRPRTPKQQVLRLQHPTLWQRLILICTLGLAIGGMVGVTRTVVMSVLPAQFYNDGNTLDINAAFLLMQGRNPYTDSNIMDLVRRFPIQSNWTTPLRQGQFANRLDYPTNGELQTAINNDLKTGQAPEFESKVSYPALSFLTLLPFAWLNDYNILPFYLLCHLLLIAIALVFARRALRPWILVFGVASVFMWTPTFGDTLDMLYTLFVVIAWLLRDHRWRSSLFLGLAIASKQIAWLFAPFYFIMTWRHYGLKEALYRLAIAGGIGLAINLPFILWNPHAWLAGILAPVVDPMFPLGIGFIELSINHLLPFFPTWVYAVLEVIAWFASLAWYWRLSKEHPESAMLLAVVPFFFAWRSLPSYFYCAAYSLFILMAARRPKDEIAASQKILAESSI